MALSADQFNSADASRGPALIPTHFPKLPRIERPIFAHYHFNIRPRMIAFDPHRPDEIVELVDEEPQIIGARVDELFVLPQSPSGIFAGVYTNPDHSRSALSRPIAIVTSAGSKNPRPGP